MTPGDDPRRQLPGVDRLLENESVRSWVARYGRGPVRDALRDTLREARRRLGKEGGDAPDEEAIVERAAARLEREARPALRRVLNATGIVLHTNLGRAPLPEEALEAVGRISGGYANLEYDLDSGGRGSRYAHCEKWLRAVTGGEGALVVNNNAAAVALVVNELAGGREVVVSRGELVEIGGSFRIPEVIERSGGRLRAVGTTNRTRLEDYRRAAGEEVGMLLKVHPSNYRMEGFVSSVDLGELVQLGNEVGVPVVHDLGSGLLRPSLLDELPPEPSPRSSLERGAALVTWSGDKLLGGPQAGLIAGAGELVDRLRSNPLLRAFRVDKMTLAALEATLALYRRETAGEDVPTLRMLRASVDEVEARARDGLEEVTVPSGVKIRVVRTVARPGGGSFPGADLPSAGWEVDGVPAERLAAACRSADPPLVGRIQEDRYVVDFRTLLPGEESAAARVVSGALEELREGGGLVPPE